MEWNKWDIYRKVLTHWYWKMENLHQNFDILLKILQILSKQFGKIMKKLWCYQMVFLESENGFVYIFRWDLFICLGLFGNDCISLTETTEPGDQFLASSHPGTELNLYNNMIKKIFFLGDSHQSFLWYWAMCLQNLSHFYISKSIARSFWNFVYF